MADRDEDFERELFASDEERRAYEEFCENQEAAARFRLDKPALVCRWRMAHRGVPMLNRHIRALSERTVSGAPLTTNMLSWAKQHVEWSLDAGEHEDPDGVLMLVIDVNGNAAMSVGSYEELPDTSSAALRERAAQARREQEACGVAPEVLCAVRDGAVAVAAGPDESPCATLSLVEQLLGVRGHEVLRAGGEADLTGALFMVSDEHGVVPASDAAGEGADRELVRFLVQGVRKLFA